jgi:hypothetical protein
LSPDNHFQALIAHVNDVLMDPVTAFGLAASVAQFVSFTSDLISKSNEIYASARGATSKILTLESVYVRLKNLIPSLELPPEKKSALLAARGSSRFVDNVLEIHSLSQQCRKDCERLLVVLDKLQVGNGSKNRWQSFKLALKTIWKGNEITELEQRLHNVQATLTLQICSLTK